MLLQRIQEAAPLMGWVYESSPTGTFLTRGPLRVVEDGGWFLVTVSGEVYAPLTEMFKDTVEFLLAEVGGVRVFHLLGLDQLQLAYVAGLPQPRCISTSST